MSDLRGRFIGPAAWVLLVTGLCLVAGCDRFPQDPNRSLEQIIERGTVRVGVTSNPPWVHGSAPGSPHGIEAELIQSWAQAQGVTPEWHWGSDQAHFEALRDGRLDVVIAGLVQRNPWKKHVGYTMPWYSHEVVVGVPPGSPHPDDLESLVVVVRPDAPWRSKLEDEDAQVVVEARPDGSRAAAVRQWELAALGLEPTQLKFNKAQQVMAVPLGENALLMSLEDHLLQQADPQRIEQALREASR